MYAVRDATNGVRVLRWCYSSSTEKPTGVESRSSSEPPSFGALLRRHRAAAGITQEELAERAGLSRRGIADLERGVRRLPYAATIRRLSDALKLDANDRTEFLTAVGRAKRSATTEVVRQLHLPAPLSSFIGRAEQIAEVRRRLATGRLVTLVGTGGIGKTRLAREVVRDLDDTGQEVAWVDLAPLRSPELVPQTVATSLGVRERPGQAVLQTLIDMLGSRAVLLVIDNCEHVLQACVEVVDALLRGCSALRVLGTSREPLHLMGEVIWRVPTLRVPAPGAQEPREILDTEAVGLFVERAQAADRTFAVTERNAPVLGELCRRLDGIPLAIELAAARVSSLSVEQIVGRLDDRFRLLAHGGPTTPQRHRTLESVLDWSYDLLTDTERLLFERLAVFAGGWTLDAAEAVCDGDGIAAGTVLPLLSQLVNKSLVTVNSAPAGDVRYQLLETVRQYASERFLGAGSGEALRRRHATYFMELAEGGDPNLHMAYERVWLEQMEREHDNVRVAIRWCLDNQVLDVGLRLCRSVVQFWYVGGHLEEAWSWLERILTMARGTGPTVVHVDVLTRAGGILRAQPAYPLARACFTEALDLARKLDYARGAADALDGLGVLASQSGQVDLARARYAEALALAEGHPLQTAGVLIDLGDLAYAQSLLDAAESCYERSAALQRGISNHHGLAVSLARLAKVASMRGDVARARAFCEESVAIREELGGRRFATISRLVLSEVALAGGNAAEAWRLAEECLPAFCDMGRLRDAAHALDLCGAASALTGHAERALELFAAAVSQRAAIGFVPPTCEQAWLEPWHTRSRAALGADAAADAWTRGLSMSLQAAVARVIASQASAPI